METAAFGAWPSPLSAATVAAGKLRISDLQCDGDDTYWIEGRATEGGRCVIVRHRGGSVEDVLPPPFSARTWVHEYGGGAFVACGGDIFFSNAADGRLHVIAADDIPRALTPELAGIRFADMVVDTRRRRLVSVVEDHTGDGVVNDLREVDLDTGEVRPLVDGHDFFAAPRLSPDGAQLAWLSWDDPNMPWDSTSLWVARLDAAGRPVQPRLVAGGDGESVVQPLWSNDSVLHFVTDRSGWWNVWRDADNGPTVAFAVDADCGVPAWVFRLSTYALLPDGRLVVGGARDGLWDLYVAGDGGDSRTVPLPYNDIDGALDVTSSGSVVIVAGSPSEALSVVRVDPTGGAHEVLRSGSSVSIPDGLLSTAQPITFPGHGGAPSHAFYYAPRNDDVVKPDDQLPPLLVRAHGGPTSATSPALDPAVQYWTSRGYAFLDVDYGGSTGYGRDYRRRLNDEQGVVDVGDCVAGAQHCAATGLADPQRLLIHGGSAGGYITLCAMTFYDVFAAGVSLFGISDLELLLVDTHKFEARYFDSLVGPYPQEQQRYHDRSPIHFINRIKKPLLLLQGLDDPIVPPNQAEVMVEALTAAGTPVAYEAYAGEQHGFRQAENIVRSMEAQLSFFWQVLGLAPAEDIRPVAISNFS
jgi:dipeptidyl aminopeptidase/acylaminoacyl peptidase